MSRSRPRIAPLMPSDADALVGFWRAEGFEATHPVEALAVVGDADEESAWIRQALDEFGDCGRLLSGDGGLVAFATYAPPALFGARGEGIAARISPDAVLLAGLCVAPRLAGRGFARVLLEAVEHDLHRRGLKAVEAFGCPDELAGRPTACRPVDFYERRGFKVRRAAPGPAIVRLELRSIVSWTENLEAVLEGLLAAGAAAIPRRAAAPTGT